MDIANQCNDPLLPELESMSAEMRAGEWVHTSSGRAQNVEDYVRAIERRSGQPCGWGYMAGRAVIYTTGDASRAAAVLPGLRWMERALHSGVVSL